MSRDETVKMKDSHRETNSHPGKVGGVEPCLSLSKTAERMVLVWRGTRAPLTGRVTELGD